MFIRDYKKKMKLYQIDKERYHELRSFCKTKEAESYIIKALTLEFEEAPDMLALWIYHHVTDEKYNWSYMEANNIPCNRDTFRIYRAKFFYELDQLLKRGEF